MAAPSAGPRPMSSIVLIKISGEDRPGVLGSLMAVLESFELRILDIGQAVVHGTLSLGVMVEIVGETRREQVLKDVLFHLHELQLNARFTDLSAADYDRWVGARGKSLHIITVFGREVTAAHLRRVAGVVFEQGLNVDDIARLSGRIPRGGSVERQRACVELRVRGEPRDPAAMKESFVAICHELGIDIAFQRDNVFRRNRRLVVFDMDSTLIQHEVIDELAKQAGVGEQVAVITEAAMRGELDFGESFRQRLALLAGLDAAVLEGIAARLVLTEGTERLFANLRALGYKSAIVSGGFRYFGEILQRRLGVDYLFANELEIEGGRLSGRAVEPIIDGPRKADLLRAIGGRERISLEQVIAVGDGANDLPMLGIAGLGIAFHAKPLVKASAGHAISTLGLDGILYLLGLRDYESLD